MTQANWDPLEKNLSSELASATIKRRIKNILKSYTGWFDPFSELIQNSLDALEKRREIENEEYEPKLWIEIDLKKGALSVTDNGIGFGEDQFKSFLAPSVSFKTQKNRGNKGVGATYLAYGFNNLQIGTRTPDFQYLGTLKNGRGWVEDDDSIETRPKVLEDTVPEHEAFHDIERGSTFTLSFRGEHVRPSDLTWIGASVASQWAAVLRVKTPLGGIYTSSSDRSANFLCNVRVIDKSGDESEVDLEECSYLYPHEVISSCAELDEIKDHQRELLEKDKDPSDLPAKFSRLNGLYNSWDYTDFEKGGVFGGKLDDDQIDLAKQYKISCYGFFCYSTDVWDHYNDEILGIRKGERLLRGGLQLATNSMPQGDLILIPLQRNIGYQNTSHVVVHFEGADPDLGRKGFQPELEQLGKLISRHVVNSFLGRRPRLKKETGAPPDITAEKKIHEWINDQEKHAIDNPLVINRDDAFLPVSRPSMTSTPLNEQDVVSLFNQLLAGGVVRGIQLMAADSHKQYDGVYRYVLDRPFDHHIYDENDNPLGVPSSNAQDTLSSKPSILEYKWSVDALISDFEKEVKSQGDVDLVVAWELGEDWKSRYEIVPLLHFDHLHHRFFHGGTHLALDLITGKRVFAAVILSELIDYLNDPEAVQAEQSDKYMQV